MDDPIGIYRLGFSEMQAQPETNEGAAEATLRDVEILFYGMACFVPLDDTDGYRVLFPAGHETNDEKMFHIAGVWVRKRNQWATACWPWFTLRNDFFLLQKRRLTITGLTPTAFNDADFDGHVTNLSDSDPRFKISSTPESVIDMIVDHGTLSSHIVNSKGMIVVRWRVKAAVGTSIRFTFEEGFVEIPPTATQIYLANVGISYGPGNGEEHFRLYRKLSSEPGKALPYVGPALPPQPINTLTLDDPTFGYFELMTPEYFCSAVQSSRRRPASATGKKAATKKRAR